MAVTTNTPLNHLEDLVDELIKDAPEETLVRYHMNAVGIRYTSDPVARLSTVLEALELARSAATQNANLKSNRKTKTNPSPAYGKSYGKDL